MNSKEKLMVFPFNIQFSPIIRHCSILENKEITSIVSIEGWGLNGKDACVADNSSNLGMTCTGNFEEQLNFCDTVFITEYNKKLDFEEEVYPKIIKAIEAGKNIICTIQLKESVEKSIQEKCEEKGVYFKYYNAWKPSNLKIDNIKLEEQRLFDFNTPIIFVTGVSERTHKFEIQLVLRERLIEAGYKLSQIGSRSYCECLGFHSLPAFMYNTTISESEKVVLLNHYLKAVELEEKPDIMVIGIPGGTMPFNNIFTNRFGILAYEISQAVTPDFSILSTLYEDYKRGYFTEMAKSLSYRFGFEADCFNISNIQFDWQESHLKSRQTSKMEYITYKSDFIDKKKKAFSELPTPVYNILNNLDGESLVSYLINKLEDYGEVESF